LKERGRRGDPQKIVGKNGRSRWRGLPAQPNLGGYGGRGKAQEINRNNETLPARSYSLRGEESKRIKRLASVSQTKRTVLYGQNRAGDEGGKGKKETSESKTNLRFKKRKKKTSERR